MASAFVAEVADSMKKQAADVAASVNETDWGSELAVFGKAVQDETVELGTKTAKALEVLPDQVHALGPGVLQPNLLRRFTDMRCLVEMFAKKQGSPPRPRVCQAAAPKAKKESGSLSRAPTASIFFFLAMFLCWWLAVTGGRMHLVNQGSAVWQHVLLNVLLRIG